MSKRGAGRTAFFGLRDIAAHAGVSHITVSGVISQPEPVAERTRRRVQEAIEKLGYVPNLAARDLVRGSSSFPERVFRRHRGGAGAGAAAAWLAADARGCGVLGRTRGEPCAWFHRSALDGGGADGDGSRPRDGAPACAEPPARGRDLGSDREADPRLRWPRQRGCRGARRPPLRCDRCPARRRLGRSTPRNRKRIAGFLAAAKERGLVGALHVELADGKAVRIGREAFAKLWEMSAAERPDALVFVSDTLAIGAWLEAGRRGVAVPAEVAPPGFGDHPLAAEILPSLSTIAAPPEEMGREAVVLIARALSGEDSRGQVRDLGTTLVARDSTNRA